MNLQQLNDSEFLTIELSLCRLNDLVLQHNATNLLTIYLLNHENLITVSVVLQFLFYNRNLVSSPLLLNFYYLLQKEHYFIISLLYRTKFKYTR